MSSRRKARITALQVLYELEVNKVGVEEGWNRYWASFSEPDIEDSESLKEFISKIVFGIHENMPAIDDQIQSSSRNWKINRMALVDRNILRIAVFELLYCSDIPKRVSINEAIELGKAFGTEDSGAFINGVLDKISQSIAKD